MIADWQELRCRRQETFVKAVFAAYLGGDILQLVDGVQKIPADKRFKPFEVSDCLPIKRALLTHLYLSLRHRLLRRISWCFSRQQS